MKKILLLIGSPKPSDSTSASLGNYLIGQMKLRNFETETVFIRDAIEKNDRIEAFLSAIDKSDIIILASPLYVDSLPYPVIKAMEMISIYRKKSAKLPAQRFMCIINCGFPEAHQNNTAIAICSQFAKDVGFKWVGALSLGEGGAIGGNPLDKLGFIARNIKSSLNLAADALEKEKPLSSEATALMEKPLIPAWIYKLIGSFMFKREAKKNQVYKNIDDCPYQKK